MTEQEFLEQQGKYFHIRLLKFYYLAKKEQAIVENSDILHFEFKEGTYDISLYDLKTKADAETIQFFDEHNLDTAPILPSPKISK